MAGWLGVAIFVVAIVLSIVLGEKLKVNQGIFAFGFAFCIAFFGSGISPAQVITKCFPGGTFYLLFITTLFYGFMSACGLTKALTDRFVYAFRNKPALIPIVLLVIAMVMSALGAGGEGTVLVLSPLFFALAVDMGFNPILAVVAAGMGAVSTSYLFWVGSGAFQIGMLEPFVGYDVAFAGMESTAICYMIAAVVVFFIYYFATKGYKVKAPSNLTKPEALTKKQKLMLIYILVVVALLFLVPLVGIFVKGAFMAKLSTFLNIRVVMTIGVIVCVITRIEDEKKVVAKYVPWNLLIMLTGMMTLISLMTLDEVGTMGFITSCFAGANLSPFLAIVIVFLVCAGLGCVTSGLNVIMILAAMAPAIAAASGLSLVAVMAVGLLGTTSLSISPYSTGGAMAISGCPDELRNSVMRKQYLCMLIAGVVCFILTIIGLPIALGNAFMG